MVKLFIDIETLPANESLKQEIAKELIPPAKLKTEPEIEQWKAQQIEDKYRKTALNGDFGRLLCIAYIKEPEGGQLIQGIITGSEPEILRQFWEIAQDADLFIGHNIMDFDLKFIIKRSIIHKIKPTKELSFARYRNNPIYDIMHEWEKWSREIKLDKLAKALGLPSSKTQLNGSQVYEYYQAGKTQEIYNYCLADVELTRKIYNRMNFIE